MQENEDKFHAISASAQDAIIMIDHEGNISFWNTAAEKILGYSNQEALGKNVHVLIAPERFLDAHHKGFRHFQQTGEGTAIGKTLELIARHKDGSEFPVELSLSAVTIGNHWHGLGIMRDITERKHTESELQKSHDDLQDAYGELQQAQSQLLQSEKMASIGQLAAGVAHEINNPVGYVYSNLGTLQKYLNDLFSVLDAYESYEPLLAQHQDALASIHAAKEKADLKFLREDVAALMSESREGITRVKTIVQNLKDFSHADSAEVWQWSDLHHGLDSTLGIVWNEIKYKAEVKKEYGEIPNIECLPSQLNQVFMNLLVNAAHAIEDKGTITIRTGTQDEGVWVEVSDTGTGIAPEHLNRIFDPFFTTKPVGKGTGLGLSISYTIIQTHHGFINVASEVGKGTTFHIWLPVEQPEAKNAT